MATLVLEHTDRAGSDRFGEILRDVGHRLDVRRLHDGDELPPDLDGIDAIVTCGGPQSPLDDSIEWMQPQIELLRAAHEQSIPIVGLCLGCEILARALGGIVEKNPAGVECGWRDVYLTPIGREDPMYTGIAWTSTQVHWHYYHIAKLPDGARTLAKSEKTPVQAWALGLRSYGFQYHPEVYRESIELWADDEPHALEEAGITRDVLRANTEKFYPTMARLSQRMFESIALMLMPLDRRFAGIAKDLHH